MAARCPDCTESFSGVAGWWEHLRECISHPSRPRYDRVRLLDALDRREGRR